MSESEAKTGTATTARSITAAILNSAITNKGYTTNTGTITKVQANGTDVASSGTANIPAASTSAYGVTKLSNSTSSTSTTLAATANAVRAAYVLADGKQSPATTLSGYGITDTYTKTEADDWFAKGYYPYGKELTDSWATLRTKIQAGNFSGINIGDYKTITLTTGEVVICEVAGIDQYYRNGDAEIGHHVDFISRDCLAGGRRFNATDTNNGTASEASPWLASELYQTLNNESTGVYSKLPSDLKSCIITKRMVLEDRYSTGGLVAADTSWRWQNAGKLWLPTEVEVFGHVTWSEPGLGTGNSLQYPIFIGGSKHIIKGDGNGGSRCNWWEASAYRTHATHFCYVTHSGSADYTNASHEGVRVPLCFRIG